MFAVRSTRSEVTCHRRSNNVGVRRSVSLRTTSKTLWLLCFYCKWISYNWSSWKDMVYIICSSRRVWFVFISRRIMFMTFHFIATFYGRYTIALVSRKERLPINWLLKRQRKYVENRIRTLLSNKSFIRTSKNVCFDLCSNILEKNSVDRVWQIW